MQILRVPPWGFDYCGAEYYGRRHSLHIGPFLIFWGQMSEDEIAAWDDARRARWAGTSSKWPATNTKEGYAMGMECGECEQDLRGGHAETCSRYRAPEPCAHCGSTRGEDVAGFCLSCDQLAPTGEATAGSATTAYSAEMMKMPDELMNLRRPPYCWCIGFAIVGRAQRLFGLLVKRPKLFRFEV